MKIDMEFQVTAICKKVENNKLTSFDKEIILDLDKSSAASFLFKFGSNIFGIEDQDGIKWTVIFRYNKVYGNFSGISFINNSSKEIYHVMNTNQLLSDISLGYYKTRTLDKIGSILDFDFEILDDKDLTGEDIPDEFDE